MLKTKEHVDVRAGEVWQRNIGRFIDRVKVHREPLADTVAFKVKLPNRVTTSHLSALVETRLKLCSFSEIGNKKI